MAAAREAFERLSRRTLEDRRRIIAHIRRIAIDQCVELGTMEMEETKIGRLAHKIEKLKTLGERAPGVEFLRSEVFSGDHGLAVIEHAPFGVIGAVTPGDALAAHDHRQRGEHDRRGQHGGRSIRIPAAGAWRPRACGATTRRSTATWASTT